MWSLKILTNSMAGKHFPLKTGDNTIGRNSHCDICIPQNGISKTHAKIVIQENEIRIVDLQSSNGTYVNGVRITQKALRPNDKISIGDFLFSIVPSPTEQAHPSHHYGHTHPGSHEHVANVQAVDIPNAQQSAWQNYLNTVIMPGIYQLPEMFEFKFVLGTFVLAFIVLVTALSVIPMVQITKASTEKESQRRALSIARNLANINQPAIQQGLTSTLTTQFADREEGVRIAVIVSARDGKILAPVTRSVASADEPFVYSARKEDQESVKQIHDDLVGASVPIRAYQPETGGYSIVAHAIVLYNMGSLAMNDGKTISLFVQTLGLALLFGFILFYFMYKMIEYPIEEINTQIDRSLRDHGSQIQTAAQFPVLKHLVVNINSAIARAAGQSSQETSSQSYEQKKCEAENIVRIVEGACFTVDANLRIIASNHAFNELLGLHSLMLNGKSIDELNDSSLVLNLQELFQQNQQNPESIATAQLEFNTTPMEIDTQAVSGAHGIEYFFCCIKPLRGAA